jgi:all-trans-retinol 13,14-reductase
MASNLGTTSSWDVIVIGSGMGGLVAAAYLAANGLRPVVLEQYDTIGGSTHVFRRLRKYEFDVGVHYLGDCEPDGNIPTILRGVGLDGAITFRPLDKDGFSTIHLADGTVFKVPAGWDAYTERLVETFPDEEKGIRRCVKVLRKLGDETDPFKVPITLADFARYPLRAPMTLRWGLRPLRHLFDTCKLSPAVRTVICGEVGVYASPPSRVPAALHAAVLQHYVRTGAYYPEGGGQVIAARLLDVIRANGGAVRTHARVEEILVEDGRAVGVRLVGGDVVRATHVVSNADVKRTYQELLAPKHVPRLTRRRVGRFRMAVPLFCVYLGLDIDLREHMPNTNIWYHPSNDLDGLFAAAYSGQVPRSLYDDPPVYITSATLKDPTNTHAAPPGHSCLQVMTLVPPAPKFWGVTGGPVSGVRYRRDADYTRAKQELTEALIAKAERMLPGIKDHIVWREGATPLTQERFTRATDGACYGLELAWDQFGPLRPGPRTRIKNLYLTGGNLRWCHGIMASMSSGVGTASAILGRNLHQEIRAGAVFGDPTVLPVHDADWDPLAASRGLATGRPPRRAVREAS